MVVTVEQAEARLYRRCGCRDAAGRQVWRCPNLEDPSHGRWYFAVQVAGPDGRRMLVRRGGFLTRGDAERGYWDLLRVPGPEALARTWTVRRFLEFWLSEIPGRLRPTTVSNYRWITYSFLIPLLGGHRLAKLRTRHVQRFLDEVGRRVGVRTGRLISPGTVHRVHAVLRTALSEARRLGMLGHNPAWRVRLPAGGRVYPVLWDAQREAAWRQTGIRPRVAVWDLSQLARFLEAVQDDFLFPLWWLVALRGPRRGEIAGLRWEDIDLPGKELRIREQVYVVDGVERVGPTKSAAGVRTIALDDMSVAILRALWHAQRHRHGHVDPQGRVFRHRNGKPVTADWLTRRFKHLVDELDLPPVRLHDLRHAAASIALAAGSDLKALQEQMGHSRIMTTLDIYAVIIRQVAQAAAQATADLLLSQARLRVPLDGAWEA
ncbi:tyrosine-type recombinase/integrase [Dactylosporangium roseum]|uniref:tyrosine-type recombinase/integrase n=1 Tax=Dactylosporangium roseum TaxID=47989 RepID=UPI0021B31D35|nr:site-specific integrase [Dactylosporangium roseum]